MKSTLQTDTEKILVISFRGGRTSGYLTKKLLEEKHKWKDVVVIFANTGQEHEKTLDFINNCDKYFAFNKLIDVFGWAEQQIKDLLNT